MKHTAIATLTAALLAALSGTTLAASADVVTFEDLPLYTPAASFSSNGFTFSGSCYGGVYANQLVAHLDGEKVYNGSQYLIWGWGSGGVLDIRRNDQTSFDLRSLDLGNSYLTNSDGAIQLTADFAAGGNYSTTLAIGDAFQTFQLGLRGLSALHLQRLEDGTWDSYTAIDNLNVAAVPEPETYAMLLAGLGVVVTAARRRSTLAA